MLVCQKGEGSWNINCQIRANSKKDNSLYSVCSLTILSWRIKKMIKVDESHNALREKNGGIRASTKARVLGSSSKYPVFKY